MKPEAHRPGPFKQQNKAHKYGRHRTKRRIESDTKGRVSAAAQIGGKVKKSLSKRDRRNQMKQIRSFQRSEALQKKRSLGQANSPPFLTAIIPLCEEETDPNCVLGRIVLSAEDHVATSCDRHITFLSVPRFKQRFSFVIPPSEDFYGILDILKVADCVLLIWPLSGELSAAAESLLSCIFAQGLPTCVNIVSGFSNLPAKKKDNCKKSLNKLLEKWTFEPKIFTCDSEADGLTLLRIIGCAKRKKLVLQERRPHLLVESIEPKDLQGSDSTLKVYGYLRGPALDVNGLIHIPGFGDFQMKQIDLVSDPHPLGGTSSKQNQSMKMKEESKILASVEVERQESLQSEIIPDHMEGEQTWPTEEELAQADLVLSGSRKKVARKVPKGTSDYQATWILEDSEDGQSLSESDNDQNEDDEILDETVSVGEDSMAMEDEQMDIEDTETVSISSRMDTDRYDEKIDLNEENSQLERFRKQRENEMFPDEIDTPMDVLARIRFQRYRGLKSFRTSPWNPDENLPSDYARIFKFENFKRTKKRVFNRERHGALHGWYICVHIADVPPTVVERDLA